MSLEGTASLLSFLLFLFSFFFRLENREATRIGIISQNIAFCDLRITLKLFLLSE